MPFDLSLIPSPWQMPLSAYLGPMPVQPWEMSQDIISSACESVAAQADTPGREWMPHPDRPEFEYAHGDFQGVLLRDAHTGETLGGYGKAEGSPDSFAIFPVVMPGHEGCGLGPELNYLAKRDSCLLSEGGQYSPSGFGAMKASHRLQVERALAAGQEVPEKVLADYEEQDGGLRLKAPYTAAEHNARDDVPTPRDMPIDCIDMRTLDPFSAPLTIMGATPEPAPR